jgi:glutamine amidotransferase
MKTFTRLARAEGSPALTIGQAMPYRCLLPGRLNGGAGVFPPRQTMITIIDYKAGNAPSVMHAVARLGYRAAFAREPRELDGSTHIILPGVGSAGATMKSLAEMGMIGPLEDAVLREKRLFLGICIGMQILFRHSEEEDADCFGWLKGAVRKYDVSNVRVPQMGWNKVNFAESPIPAAKENYFYFVNSYHAEPEDEKDVWGTADYDGPFTAAVHRDNIYATQFHVEKSGEAGLALLGGFLGLGEGGRPC